MSITKTIKQLNKDIQKSIYQNIFSILDTNCNNAWFHYTHTEGCVKDKWKKEFMETCNTYRRILGKVGFLK